MRAQSKSAFEGMQPSMHDPEDVRFEMCTQFTCQSVVLLGTLLKSHVNCKERGKFGIDNTRGVCIEHIWACIRTGQTNGLNVVCNTTLNEAC
jgi:hypothetical protein